MVYRQISTELWDSRPVVIGLSAPVLKLLFWRPKTGPCCTVCASESLGSFMHMWVFVRLHRAHFPPGFGDLLMAIYEL